MNGPTIEVVGFDDELSVEANERIKGFCDALLIDNPPKKVVYVGKRANEVASLVCDLHEEGHISVWDKDFIVDLIAQQCGRVS